MEVGKEDARRFLVARQLLVPARSLTGGPDSVLEVVRVEVARRVLDRIRVEGPLSSGDFERQGGPTKDWFGAPKNAVRAVLEAYALTGELGTARREGNRRYYDVVERLLPSRKPLRLRVRLGAVRTTG